MKNGILLSTLLTIGTSLSSPLYISKNNINQNITNSSKALSLTKAQTEKKIIDFDKLVQRAVIASANAIDPNLVSDNIVSMNYQNLKISDVSVSPREQPKVVENPTAIYMGSNELSNDLDYAQTMSTTSFERQVTNTITSSTTVGLSYKLEAKYEFISGSVQVDFSTTDTKTTSSQIDVLAPSQNIVVPPHTKYKVSVYLGQNQAKVNLDLHARISGRVTVVFTDISNERDTYSIDIASAFGYLGSLPQGISIDNKTNQVVFDGVAIAQNIAQNDTFTVSIDQEK